MVRNYRGELKHSCRGTIAMAKGISDNARRRRKDGVRFAIDFLPPTNPIGGDTMIRFRAFTVRLYPPQTRDFVPTVDQQNTCGLSEVCCLKHRFHYYRRSPLR